MGDVEVSTAERWLKQLKAIEMRAFSGTLRSVASLLDSGESSAKQLAAAILKDPMLTARVLQVANSVSHQVAAQPLSTEVEDGAGALTQAVVRIGYGSLRAICISVALMETLLRKNPHSEQLRNCVAISFQTAVHARNMAHKLGANEEDIFIAGLLQNLGELLFWCSDMPDSPDFQELCACAVDTPEQAFKQLCGKDFRELSQWLAGEWRLSGTLSQSFGFELNNTTKAVSFGRRIPRAVEQGWASEACKDILQSLAKEFKFDLDAATELVRSGMAEAAQLSASYLSERRSKRAVACDTQAAEPVKPEADVQARKPTPLIRS